MAGVEKSEKFVKELQKYGLTFGEYSDAISIGDESRLAFSDYRSQRIF